MAVAMASPKSPQFRLPLESPQPDIVVSPVEEKKSSLPSSDEESDVSEPEDGMNKLAWRNRLLQEHFASGMKDIGQERSHKKTAVLLLEWEKDGEDYMDTRDEVSHSLTPKNRTLLM